MSDGKIATATSVVRTMKDFFPQPGERIKQYVVDMRREDRWERETCPRIQVPVHEDNTGVECSNSNSSVPWIDLDHHCCYVCGDLSESTRELVEARGWFAAKAARPPICDDLDKLSDQIAPDLAMRAHTLLAMIPRDR